MNRRDFIKLVGGLITIPIVAFTKEIPETGFTMKSVPINCTTKKLGNIPASKTCSVCGEKNAELKLKDRKWTCTKCNTKHDRDINAAINLKNTAGTVEINACENMNTQ